MSYVRPEEVLSPKRRVGGIHRGDPRSGLRRNEPWPAFLWDGEAVIAARWNGNAGQPLGNANVPSASHVVCIIDNYAAARRKKLRASPPNSPQQSGRAVP